MMACCRKKRTRRYLFWNLDVRLNIWEKLALCSYRYWLQNLRFGWKLCLFNSSDWLYISHLFENLCFPCLLRSLFFWGISMFRYVHWIRFMCVVNFVLVLLQKSCTHLMHDEIGIIHIRVYMNIRTHKIKHTVPHKHMLLTCSIYFIISLCSVYSIIPLSILLQLCLFQYRCFCVVLLIGYFIYFRIDFVESRFCTLCQIEKERIISKTIEKEKQWKWLLLFNLEQWCSCRVAHLVLPILHIVNTYL